MKSVVFQASLLNNNVNIHILTTNDVVRPIPMHVLTDVKKRLAIFVETRYFGARVDAALVSEIPIYVIETGPLLFLLASLGVKV